MKTISQKTKKQSRSIEKHLESIDEKLTKLNKEIDMTQKIVHVEVATNAIRTKQELEEKMKSFRDQILNSIDTVIGKWKQSNKKT